MLDQFREDYEAFNSALMREFYLFHSGQKQELTIGPIYERYGGLFTPDVIHQLMEALREKPEYYETERNALRNALVFVVDHHLDTSVIELTEAINKFEAGASIEWNGRTLTFLESAAVLLTEPDRQLRYDLYARRAAIISATNDLRVQRLVALHKNARKIIPPEQAEIEINNYRALYEFLSGLKYEPLSRQANELIDRTESIYCKLLTDELHRELGIELEDAERHDAGYLFHLSRYDGKFPARELIPVYKETMAGLGIEVDLQPAIEIDIAARPNKNIRAFCAPICVPQEIKLVVRPVGGQSDYQTFLHEAGHSQHYAWTSKSLKPELKYTGDRALSESYAFLFNYLVCDEKWLSGIMGVSNCAECARAIQLSKLMTVRRYGAKLAFESQLHSGLKLESAPEEYAFTQTNATKLKTGDVECLFDLDDSFYSADYLRAWAFEVMLRDYLMTRYDRKWWTSERAGRFLRELWETGNTYRADEVASQLGIGPITFEPLIEEFTCVNRSSTA